MIAKRPLSSKEISSIVEAFDPVDWVQMELLATLPPGQRILIPLQKAEMVRTDLRNKLMEDFSELSLPEINMKVLRSLTPVRIGRNYTEPAYYGWLC
ncbi:MAG: hypothetical protein ABI621_16855 [Chloroflexota bacterium]